jgi:YD repeat-containing protein
VLDGGQTRIPVSFTSQELVFVTIGRLTCVRLIPGGTDREYTRNYLPGGLTDPDVQTQLRQSNQGDTRAYSQTEYWDDPLGRPRVSYGPGDPTIYGVARSWVFGVDSTVDKTNFAVSTVGTVDIKGGVITSLTVSAPNKTIADLFDCLYDQFITANPYRNDEPGHVLSISCSPDGKIAEELKNKFGRTVKTFSAPDINSTTGSKIISEYHHDILGNVLTEIPPGNLISNTSYQYNTLGQLVRKVTPDGGLFTYDYNPDGSLANMQSRLSDANETCEWLLVYAYDELGRKTAVNEYRSGCGRPPVTVQQFYYDDVANIPSVEFSVVDPAKLAELTNLKGRLVASLTTNHGVQSITIGELYSYDDDGRIERKIMTIGGEMHYQDILYSYDIHGKVSTERFFYGTDHMRKRFVYDELGRLKDVYSGYLQSNGTTYTEQKLVESDFDALGKLNKKNYSAIGSSYDITFGYDILDRMTSSASPAASNGYGQVITYGISGNITTSRHDYILPGLTQYTQSYEYDDLNRLITASAGTASAYDAAYTYDNIGRFVSKQEGTRSINGYEYYENTSRLKRASNLPANNNREYIYDKRGNLVVDFSKNMVIEYDWRDLPVTFRFYNDLTYANITKNTTTGTCTIPDLYRYMETLVAATGSRVHHLSTVCMLYDASGNRVCKMNVAN